MRRAGLQEGRNAAEQELEEVKRRAEVAKRRAEFKLRKAQREADEMRTNGSAAQKEEQVSATPCKSRRIKNVITTLQCAGTSEC